MAQPAFGLESVIKRRGFIWRSFDIYGGTAGFYDYGPLGTALKSNIISIWRRFFVHEEGFAEIDTPNLTPHEVFKASGHLDKFNDLMLECSKCGTLYKAEGLFSDNFPTIIENHSIVSLKPEELGTIIQDKDVTCPECGGQFKPPYEFNLMFKTTIGRDKIAYLHPETAQGIFMNFHNLYGYHREKLPFGAAQVGKGFRNEISPRQGVIRLREFNMAEAEVFIDPDDNDYPKFDAIRSSDLVLLDQHGAFHYLTAGEAVEEGIICNKALAYFIVRTRDFLLEIGVNEQKLRFRQHMKDEMAHYAKDCWDAEILMEINGKESWIECVGVANRSCYDLEQHMKATGQDLRAFKRFDVPIERKVERIKPDLPRIGKTFKKHARIVCDHLTSLSPPFPEVIEIELDGEKKVIAGDMFVVEEVVEKITGRRFVPAVIEPSFGIDRILYALLQHSYMVGKARESEDSESYTILKLDPSVSPIKTGVFPLFNRPGMIDISQRILDSLIDSGITARYDDSGSIGKRYARMDEVGTPYCITIDHQSIEDGSVTIRDRDSTEQLRIPGSSAAITISGLISGSLNFHQLSEN